MVKTKSRQFELPKLLEDRIEKILKQFNLSISDSQKIAGCIQKMSDFYIQKPDKQTPWNEGWAQVAQAAYYLPLNFLRCQAVINEAYRVDFFDGIDEFFEVGSGFGALTYHLEKILPKGTCVEISEEALKLHKSFFDSEKIKFTMSSSAQTPNNRASTLLAMSYVMTETGDHKNFRDSSSVLIVEPSTQQDGRKLMELRQKLIDQGFYIWAPCTHQGKCPLLTQSNKDWCHDRIHLQMPDWFLEIEKFLKIKNKTITFSYLLAKREKLNADQTQKARIVGDMQEERGKTKTMICRAEKREFLTWLHKDKLDIEIHRGDLINLDFPIEEKVNELRIKK